MCDGWYKGHSHRLNGSHGSWWSTSCHSNTPLCHIFTPQTMHLVASKYLIMFIWPAAWALSVPLSQTIIITLYRSCPLLCWICTHTLTVFLTITFSFFAQALCLQCLTVQQILIISMLNDLFISSELHWWNEVDSQLHWKVTLKRLCAWVHAKVD